MNEKKTTWARAQMLLIALVFFGPLVVATFMYYGGYLQPDGRTNHGALLQPIVNIGDALPHSELVGFADGYWVLVYENPGVCEADCERALYTLRQSRKMLGRDMERLKRLFLHGDSAPDTVFLADEHAGLITLQDRHLAELLSNKIPAELAAGGYFLIDPLGNLVMYFEPGIDPGEMVADIEHLLKLSSIG